jgi:hypothetical protein
MVRNGVFALAMALAGSSFGQATAHYVPGVEGLKGSTLPPPGLYLRDYNQFYAASRLNDNDGDRIRGIDFDTFVYAQVPRLVWMTDLELLGGRVGVDGLWPIVYQDVEVNTPVGRFDESTLSYGDPFAEVTLTWNLPQLDVSVGVGEWFPVGEYSAPPSTRAGLGYWTTMFTAGVTWYLDEAKTLAVSALNRYETNSHQRNTGVTPGDAYTLEWGISKAVCPAAHVGVVGYYQRQITHDSGTGSSDRLDGVAAIGPEVLVGLPQQSLFLSLRYNYEFWAVNRAQGHNVVLTATYRF